MKIRIIYSDLTEWVGDTSEFNTSPLTGICQTCRGILTITVFYNYPYKLILNGNDYYAIRDLGDQVEIAVWADYLKEGQAWIIKRDTYEQRDWRFPKENFPQFMVCRIGKWASDENMEVANKRAMEWL